jgi:2-methylcitrate dehydratase
VALVKIATAAVVTRLLGGGRDEIINAVSNAIVDGHPLNIYRTTGNAGSRKSWAGGDAAGRAVWLVFMTMRGEMGYMKALTAKTWGFQEVLYKGKALDFWRPLGSYVIENITFKISHPAQRSAQTAAECAVRLHPLVRDRLDEVERIDLHTHNIAVRDINVTGALANFAARDHCLQYIAAVGLLDGDITTQSYSDEYHATHPRIDELRAKMKVIENDDYTRGYRDPNARSNTNAVQVFFVDGSKTPKIEIAYPIGNARRRKEGVPLLEAKFKANLAKRFPAKRQEGILELFGNQRTLEAMPVDSFTDMLAI